MSARSAVVLISCAFALLAGACRSGEEEPCRCGSDCRSGLVCFVEGEGDKVGDACAKAGVQGICLLPMKDSAVSGDSALPEMPVYEDLPSRRDLAPGTGSASDSASGTTDTTTDATGTSTTGTSTDATTGTSTTGTSTTGTSTTGTSTTDASTTDASTTENSTDTSTTDTSTSSGGSTT